MSDGERAARARYEAGLPMLSDVGQPGMPQGSVADEPVAELTLALVDEHGRVDGTPTRALVGISYASGEYAEQTVEGVRSLAELLARLLDQLGGPPVPGTPQQ